MKLLIGVVIAAFVVIVGFLAIDPNLSANQAPAVTETINNAVDNLLSVSIEGQIEKPGTYSLSEGSTMIDLINAAGGVSPNADERAFFETTIVTKGKTYYIPPVFNDDDVCATEEIKKVNINTDNSETLMTVNGFTSSIAKAVIDYRSENGQFEAIDDLEKVYGIGPATFRKVRNFVILHP